MVSRRESRGPRVRRERWGRRRSREKRYVITHRVPHPAPLQISKHNGGFDVSPGRKRTVATLCSQRLSLHGGETRRELWRRERWQEWIKSFFVGRYNSDSCCLCCYRMNLDRSPFPLPIHGPGHARIRYRSLQVRLWDLASTCHRYFLFFPFFRFFFKTFFV